MTTPSAAKAALVRYLQGQADARGGGAPSATLVELARWVDEQPEDDARFATLAGIDVVRNGWISVGEKAGRLVSSYRDGRDADAPDRFFTRFVDALVSDVLKGTVSAIAVEDTLEDER